MLRALSADGDAVIDYIRQEQPEILLVGVVSLPQDSRGYGPEPVDNSDIPVIMLSARIDEIEHLLALQTAAGHAVCKPFSRQQMIGHLKALLHRLEARPANDSGVFGVNEERMKISYCDQELDLTPREYQLLAVLLSRPGRVFSRDFLMERLHPHWDDVSDRSIDSHVKNLRKKLAALAANRVVIHTIYGVGYRIDV